MTARAASGSSLSSLVRPFSCNLLPISLFEVRAMTEKRKMALFANMLTSAVANVPPFTTLNGLVVAGKGAMSLPVKDDTLRLAD